MSPGRNKTKCSPHLVKDEAKTTRLLQFWKNEVKRRELAKCFKKTKVKRIGVFKKFKFVKTKQNEVNSFGILQDRSNIFVSNCVEGEKQ
jgi:hypothetical protein